MRFQDLTIETNAGARLFAEESAPGQTRITAEWDRLAAERPVLTIGWETPLHDIQYGWHPNCRFDRSLRVDWGGPVTTKISSSAPVFCFFNEAGRARVTIALSDAKTPINSSLGVREEDGMLLCRVAIPLDATGVSHRYGVTLLRDGADRSFAEALRLVSRWWETECGYRPAPVPGAARTAMYSTWYTFHQGVFADAVEAECAIAAQMGMKTVIVDDGWQTDDGNRGYAYCGDWEVTKNKIPDMAAHVKRVHGMGLKYMLWYSVPFMGYKARRFPEFEGMLLDRLDSMQAGVLDPRWPQVREYLVSVYDRALREWDLDGFKLDFIDSFRARGAVPTVREGMDFALVEDAVDRLMTDVLTALRARKPEVLVEFRQSYIGPAMRGYGNMFRVADCPADPLSNRVGSLDLRLLSGSTAVHSDMLMWHRDDTPEAAALQLISVLFAVPQISVKLTSLHPEQRAALEFWLGFMEREKALLLGAPLEVESPQDLYSLARAEADGRAVIALYAPERAVSISPVTREAFLCNGTFAPSAILRLPEGARCAARVFDCQGRAAGEREISGSLCELPVPACGMARLLRL